MGHYHSNVKAHQIKQAEQERRVAKQETSSTGWLGGMVVGAATLVASWLPGARAQQYDSCIYTCAGNDLELVSGQCSTDYYEGTNRYDVIYPLQEDGYDYTMNDVVGYGTGATVIGMAIGTAATLLLQAGYSYGKAAYDRYQARNAERQALMANVHAPSYSSLAAQENA